MSLSAKDMVEGQNGNLINHVTNYETFSPDSLICNITCYVKQNCYTEHQILFFALKFTQLGLILKQRSYGKNSKG